MNLKNLETFIWCARLGSFRAAALKLNATQPTVSMRIKNLESAFGIELFDRTHQSNKLTPKGRELLQYGESIIKLIDEATSRVANTSHVSGHVKLGVTETIAMTWLPDLVRQLDTNFPRLRVELEVGLTNVVWSQLMSGEIDLALLPGPVRGVGLVSQSLGLVDYKWMASPKLELPDRDLTPTDLKSQSIITLSSDSNLHNVISDWFKQSGADHWRTTVCNSLSVVSSLTIAELGVSLMPPEIFQDQLSRNQLKVVETKLPLNAMEFVSCYPTTGQPIVAQIALAAQSCSTFRSLN